MTLEKLVKGFRAFRAIYLKGNDYFDELAREGQSPETLVIACSDSRNDPALLTQSEPGDIFVVRNVAALVPPYQPDDNYHGTSAAIEFAVKGLKVKNIIVLGHATCGGVQALAESTDKKAKSKQFEFLSQWIKIGESARVTVEKILSDAPPSVRLVALEQAMILTSLNNLMTFPWIKKAVEQGTLTLHGWYFDMVNGKLLDYDFSEGLFKEIRQKKKGFPDKPDIKSGCTDCSCSWPIEQLIKNYA